MKHLILFLLVLTACATPRPGNGPAMAVAPGAETVRVSETIFIGSRGFSDDNARILRLWQTPVYTDSLFRGLLLLDSVIMTASPPYETHDAAMGFGFRRAFRIPAWASGSEALDTYLQSTVYDGDGVRANAPIFWAGVYAPQAFVMPAGAVACVVARAPYDGDGLRVRNLQTGAVFTVRFMSTDAPEIRGAFVSATQPGGYAMRDSLRTLVRVGDTVYVDLRPAGRVRVSFGRKLADVYLDDAAHTHIGYETIRRGWAWYRPTQGRVNTDIALFMSEAFARARELHIGVFAAPATPPWKWRDLNAYKTGGPGGGPGQKR